MKRIHTIALGIALGLASLTAASAFPSNPSKVQHSAQCPPCGEPVPTCTPTSPNCGPS